MQIRSIGYISFIFLFGLLIPSTQGAEPKSEAVEFFEKSIRPILIEKCYKCHSSESKSLKGSLKVDSRDDLIKGGDSGAAIVPGKPHDSLLVKAVRYQDESLQMPPKQKLSDKAISDIEKWIAEGAPFPKSVSIVNQDPKKSHWSFQPMRKPQESTSIDTLIEAKLHSKGFSLSSTADKRTLLRRVYFDLVGLPPTYEEIQAFEKDPDPNAFAKVIDQLLASPRYGERWGRHWLDVARFADTKDGVLMYGIDRIRPFAYTYRDYVIRAFNEDLSFDRFIHEQLSADLIEPKVEPWRLAAMGFLTLGRQFDNNIHDIIDDRIDTVSRGFLGLTVSCARCHDHKYDPIPIGDYYSLYGVFASCEQPAKLPPIDPNQKGPEAFEKQYANSLNELEKTLDSQYVLLSEQARSRVTDYLVHVVSTKPDPLETAIFFLSLAPEDLRPPIIARWRTYLNRRVKPDDPIFAPWYALFALPEEKLAVETSKTISELKNINPLIREALLKAKLTSKVDIARTYGMLLKQLYDESKTPKPPVLDENRKQLLEILTSQDSPAYFPKSLTRNYMSRAEKDGFGGKLQNLDNLAVKETNAPGRAMVLIDSFEIHNPRIFRRGNPSAPGDSVPRQFLNVLSANNRQPFPHGSGRFDLAKAITDPNNPLTARVMVNRIWMHHFGEPLVETPNDFGLRCNAPIHPELLDFLATSFRDNGWSIKKLHRQILLSRAYQQASLDRPECRKVDPDNKLLWRQSRQRLEFEAMRDAMLTVSGRIQHQLYGRPVDVANDAKNVRRTVYGLVDRQSLPGVFRAFDFASPDQSAEKRPQTTVPQQALFGMNSPFVLQQAESLINRPEVAKQSDLSEKIKTLYRLILQRDALSEEVKLGITFIQSAEKSKGSKQNAWQQYAQVLLLTNEFFFVD